MRENSLKRLYNLGQSPWYDNIDRRLLNNGRLNKIVENGIVGLTSNPTIFQKAVAASPVYNEEIEQFKKEHKTPKEIYDELTISDVRRAADILKSIYTRTNAQDGYVSIEVYPEYAHNPEETIRYAKMLYKRLGRDNIMIKVPGTKEGYVAIRNLIREGINVNVTLLFSIEHYEMAARAYLDGLNDRLRENKRIDSIASVASVFVSRIDTHIDNLLEKQGKELLKGKIAVANTKIIYQRFKEIFYGTDFAELKKYGARIQRPLWASTSTKNPFYSDIKYVEELIGKDTINTLPHTTMEAFLDHGEPRLSIEDDLYEAKNALTRLAELDIDLSGVCQVIQDEGVDAFQASFDKLIETIQK